MKEELKERIVGVDGLLIHSLYFVLVALLISWGGGCCAEGKDETIEVPWLIAFRFVED